MDTGGLKAERSDAIEHKRRKPEMKNRHLTRSPHPQPLSHPMGEGGVGLSPVEAEREEKPDANEHDFSTAKDANCANEEECMPQSEESFPDILELMRQSAAATQVNQPPVGHKARGLWKTLEAFAESHPPAAVLASWRHHTGPEYGMTGTFLRAAARAPA
jgi:hypothetical protein